MSEPAGQGWGEGLVLLLERRWFEAHERWEEVWRPHPPGPRRELLQGLIQAAVALEHLRRGNARGARKVWERARPRLLAAPPWVEGLGVEDWRLALERFFARVDLPGREARQEAGGTAAAAAGLPPPADWPLPPVRGRPGGEVP